MAWDYPWGRIFSPTTKVRSCAVWCPREEGCTLCRACRCEKAWRWLACQRPGPAAWRSFAVGDRSCGIKVTSTTRLVDASRPPHPPPPPSSAENHQFERDGWHLLTQGSQHWARGLFALTMHIFMNPHRPPTNLYQTTNAGFHITGTACLSHKRWIEMLHHSPILHRPQSLHPPHTKSTIMYRKIAVCTRRHLVLMALSSRNDSVEDYESAKCTTSPSLPSNWEGKIIVVGGS